MTTPSPRPAALVIEAIAEAIYIQDSPTYAPGFDKLGTADRERNRDLAEVALLAASRAGFVLIPRAELEEAADWIYRQPGIDNGTRDDLANRLRQRSRG